MDKLEIRKQIVKIANETLDLETLITEADLSGQLNDIDNNLLEQMDSINLLALAVAIEDHFRICIEPEDEEQIKCFDDLINVIHQQLSKSQIVCEGENQEQSNS